LGLLRWDCIHTWRARGIHAASVFRTEDLRIRMKRIPGEPIREHGRQFVARFVEDQRRACRCSPDHGQPLSGELFVEALDAALGEFFERIGPMPSVDRQAEDECFVLEYRVAALDVEHQLVRALIGEIGGSVVVAAVTRFGREHQRFGIGRLPIRPGGVVLRQEIERRILHRPADRTVHDLPTKGIDLSIVEV